MKPDSSLTKAVLGACLEVHRHLGPGLLESAYEECVAFELHGLKLQFERQKPLPILYKGRNLDCVYRLDFVVENQLVIELKSVEQLLPIHKAQVITYLKLAKMNLGLLINFNVPLLKDGMQRVILDLPPTSVSSVSLW